MRVQYPSVLILAAACALAACAAPPPAQEAPAQEPAGRTAATAESPAEAGPESVVCSLEQQTGSRFKKKVCRTRAEIEAMSHSARETMKTRDRTSGNANQMTLPGGG